MSTDGMALIRALSAHVGQPDFLDVAERIKRQLAEARAPERANRPYPTGGANRALRRPATTPCESRPEPGPAPALRPAGR